MLSLVKGNFLRRVLGERIGVTKFVPIVYAWTILVILLYFSSDQI